MATAQHQACQDYGVLVQSLVAQAREQHRQVQLQHVPGHSGNPWNELADSVCTAVQEGKIAVTELPGVQALSQQIRRWFSGAAFPLVGDTGFHMTAPCVQILELMTGYF